MHFTPRLTARKGLVARRAVLSGFALPFLPRFAQAAEVVWRIGHSAPASFALNTRLVEVAATIQARSGGQMSVEVYPAGELGSPVGLLAQVRAGTLDGAPLTNQMLAGSLSVSTLPKVGFAFAGYDQVWPAMDGAVGNFLRDQMQQRLGLIAMERSWDFGFRQITTTAKAISTVTDLDGLRLRTPPEVETIALFQALKARPVPMPLTELRAALATYTIDGQESVLPLVKAAELYNVQSFCAMTNHMWEGQWICVSGKSWSKLPDKLKQTVAEAFNASALLHRQDTAAADAVIRVELDPTRMKFTTIDPQPFRKALRTAGYYATLQKKFGDDAWNALEQYTGRLA